MPFLHSLSSAGLMKNQQYYDPRGISNLLPLNVPMSKPRNQSVYYVFDIGINSGIGCRNALSRTGVS